MSQLSQAILGKDTAYAQGASRRMLDLRYGGMNGFTHQMNQWVSNAGYVQRNGICLVLELPAGLNDLANADYWKETIRAIMELHSTGFEGIDTTMTVEVADTSAIGTTNEAHQDVTRVSLKRSSITHTVPEKAGRPVAAAFQGWVRNLIADPYSQVPAVATFAGSKPEMWLPDYYSMTCAYIETDQMHRYVTKGVIATNMFPRDDVGQDTIRMEKNAAGQPVNYQQGFTSIVTTGAGIEAYCQRLLDDINIAGANPYTQRAFPEHDTTDGGFGGGLVSADLADRAFGYKDGAQSLPNNNINIG